METIYKYEIPAQDEFTLDMHEYPEFLSVQVQRGTPVLWAIVDTDSPKKTHKFRLYGTGHEMRESKDGGLLSIKNRKYLGSFQIENEMLAFHLFHIQD